MALSRRNILVGLGALVGGGGALVGTGAFSTVSAERSVSVSTAGDNSAFLTITGDSQYVNDDSGNGTLTINLGGPSGNNSASGFNDNAITKLESVVTITNNAPSDASNASTKVGLSELSPGSVSGGGSGSQTLTIPDGNSGYADVTFYVDNSPSVGSGNRIGIDSGSSVHLDVEIDTTVSPNNPTTDDTLTIVATGSNTGGSNTGGPS